MNNTFIADPTDSRPLCEQVYHYLKSNIENGFFPAGSYLPSENSMIAEYGVSRITVRRAVSDLEQNGYVKKHRGRGSMVLELTPSKKRVKVESAHQRIKRAGGELMYILINASYEDCDEKWAELLHIPVKSKIFKFNRIATLNGKIYSYLSTGIPYKPEWNHIYEEPERITSLYERIQESGIVLDYMEENFTICIPPENVRHILSIKDEEVAVSAVHIGYTEDNEIVEYTQSYVIAEQFNYTIINRHSENE